jgi:hypothetical protein
MNTFNSFAIRTLALTAIAAATLSSANAAIFFRTRVVVAPVAPVVVAPVVVTPVVAAPVVVLPTCRFVSVPVVNAWTGITYMVTRQVCN